MRHLTSRISVTKPVNVRIAWLLWATLFFVATTSTFAGHPREVTHHYRDASLHWFGGKPLYETTGHGFLYFPQAAILFAPFAYLPPSAGEILWRATILAVYAAGVCRLARLAGRATATDFFPLTTMFCLPLAFASERNGQATLIMAGLMMVAAVDLVDRRWWRAAIYLSLGLAIKPLCLVMVLLVAILYPVTIWRMALCIGLLAAMPFLTADATYVISQYVDCYQMLGHAVDRGREANWAQLFGMLQVAGIQFSPLAQSALRLLAAAATLLLLLIAERRLPRAWTGTFCYVLAVCFLMLFNPRTENNSYSALAPAIGILCCHDFLVRQNYRMAVWYIFISVGILSTYYVGRLFTGPEYTTWLSPLMGACFAGVAIVQLLRGPKNESGNDSLVNRPTSRQLPESNAA
jgi:alpha-1,2-mannosyltransferase